MLNFTHATMGAGKSAILIAKAISVLDYALVLKPAIDTRDGVGVVSSRNGSSLPCEILNTPENTTETIERLLELKKEKEEKTGKKLKFIFVDEAQFLTMEEVHALLTISLQHDIIIECYGLLTDFRTYLFEGSKRLVELADNIEHIVSYSKDGNPTKQNARFVDGVMMTEGEVVMLGKEEAYRPLSNREYFLGGQNG